MALIKWSELREEEFEDAVKKSGVFASFPSVALRCTVSTCP